MRGLLFTLNVAVFVLVCSSTYAQQDNTLFMMHNIPQSNFLNPAIQINCLRYVGVPMLSSFHFNANSTGFSYGDISQGSAIDVRALVSQMHGWDYLSGEVHYTPVSFGFMYDRYRYFSFAWTERIETKLFVPRKLVSLFANGNTQYVSNGLKTSNPGLNAFYYREFSIGYSKKVQKDLMLGVHAKILFGLAGITTRRNPVSMDINPLTYNIDAKWKPEVNTTYPLSVSTDAQGNVNNISLSGFSPLSFFMNFGNQGLAFDFGFIKEKGKITYSGSILDLGFIWWHKNTTRFVNSGHFVYRGATTDDINNPSDYISELGDSISNQVKFSYNKKGYLTFLNPKVYFGATYPVHPQINVGGLIRAEWYPGRPVVGATLSATVFGVKGGSLALTYSAMNGSFMNIGFGVGWGGEKFQFYTTTDNFMVAFFPEKARNANLRFGLNLFFGCTEEKKKKVNVPRTNGCGCYWDQDLKEKRKQAGVN
ncbi:MAG TPA: DUF5723 family protein [Tenuifilaceae bacterium]|nr:DUF5723 family protein [Tenuifilaceae bacterium]HRX32051.1 DUF5723 family protein [Tenuifilaceae bacterium]